MQPPPQPAGPVPDCRAGPLGGPLCIEASADLMVLEPKVPRDRCSVRLVSGREYGQKGDYSLASYLNRILLTKFTVMADNIEGTSSGNSSPLLIGTRRWREVGAHGDAAQRRKTDFEARDRAV